MLSVLIASLAWGQLDIDAKRLLKDARELESLCGTMGYETEGLTDERAFNVIKAELMLHPVRSEKGFRKILTTNSPYEVKRLMEKLATLREATRLNPDLEEENEDKAARLLLDGAMKAYDICGEASNDPLLGKYFVVDTGKVKSRDSEEARLWREFRSATANWTYDD
ncbi:hypothetical protein [Sphingomicrobium clamense]|uniref:Uncharacterized protein n=1 Tax=Sphingomicrobium clamense TaxID=2851013 RepID=A0ABS6V884_9SPHN|nr:hypothetical protein [Sphingomicrobium sp. B8]MBW0145783.1 hypothetical protein [Sphingomicrobium sp. B8]